MPPRIPTEADFSSLDPALLSVALHFPNPPESTTAFLILFHGLGDSETPFLAFARSLNLPGVLAISVRGTSRLPVPDGGYHWGDDVLVDQRTGDLDPEPGFGRASALVREKLVGEILVEKCGWEAGDVILFGFGQGGSLALSVADELDGTLKGVVSVGGGLRARRRNKTPVLLVQVDDETEDRVRDRFENVSVVRWSRQEVDMPRNRDEAFPIIKFFADRLRSAWV